MGLPCGWKDLVKNSDPGSQQTPGQERMPGSSSAIHKFTSTPSPGHSCKPHAVHLPLQGPRCESHLIEEAISKWPHNMSLDPSASPFFSSL